MMTNKLQQTTKMMHNLEAASKANCNLKITKAQVLRQRGGTFSRKISKFFVQNHLQDTRQTRNNNETKTERETHRKSFG